MNKTIGIIITLLVILGGLAVEGAIAMMLWNWVIVGLFHAAAIDFWLGLGIVFVINLAYGLFRPE